MSGGETKQESSPWKAAVPYLTELMGRGGDIFGSQTGKDYQKEYVGLTPQQNQIMEQMNQFYGTGGQYEQNIGGAQTALDRMLVDPSVTAQSPETQALIQSLQNPIMTQLNEQMMPEIRAGAGGSGQYGSTRQGVAEGVAAGKATSAMGDVAAKTSANAYNQAMQNYMQAIQFQPTLAKAGAGGMEQQMALENMLRQEQQTQTDVDRYNRTQADWGPLQAWASLLYPTAGMGGTTVQKQGVDPLQTAIGLGSLGLGAYGAFSAAAAPAAAGGAGGAGSVLQTA